MSLFIGGSQDRKLREIHPDKWEVEFPIIPDITSLDDFGYYDSMIKTERYRRYKFKAENRIFSLFVENSLTLDEALEKVFIDYHENIKTI